MSIITSIDMRTTRISTVNTTSTIIPALAVIIIITKNTMTMGIAAPVRITMSIPMTTMNTIMDAPAAVTISTDTMSTAVVNAATITTTMAAAVVADTTTTMNRILPRSSVN